MIGPEAIDSDLQPFNYFFGQKRIYVNLFFQLRGNIKNMF